MKRTATIGAALAAAMLVAGPAAGGGEGRVDVRVYDHEGGHKHYSFSYSPPVRGSTPRPGGFHDDMGPVQRGEETFEEYMNRKYPESSSQRINACAQDYFDTGDWCGDD